MFDDDRNKRQIIAGDIDRHPMGSRLTPEAKQRAVDFGASLKDNSLNWGQITEASVKHVTSGVLKD